MKRTMSMVLPVAGLLATFLAWGLATILFDISDTILPSPVAVGHALYKGVVLGELYPHIAFTFTASLVGAAIGIAGGFLLGLVVGESTWANRFIYPVVAGLQAMPMIAAAPLLMLWLGLGMESKVALVAFNCVAPIFVSTVAGLNSAPPALINLYRSLGASRYRRLFHIKLPSALDYIFSGIQIAVVLSFINCVVGEFVASQQGLGFLIKSYSGQLEVSMMFAAILCLAIMGGATSRIVQIVHKRVVHWAN